MLKKMVNGKEVICSPQEEASIRAEWAENDRPRTPTEISDAQDAQVDKEFTPALIAIINAIDPVNAGTILASAKAARKLEL